MYWGQLLWRNMRHSPHSRQPKHVNPPNLRNPVTGCAPARMREFGRQQRGKRAAQARVLRAKEQRARRQQLQEGGPVAGEAARVQHLLCRWPEGNLAGRHFQ